jgi:hypothetical protein
MILIEDRFWHFSDMAARLADVRFRGQSGKHMLVLSLTAFDPSRHRTSRNPAVQQSPAVLRCAILSIESMGGARQ